MSVWNIVYDARDGLMHHALATNGNMIILLCGPFYRRDGESMEPFTFIGNAYPTCVVCARKLRSP